MSYSDNHDREVSNCRRMEMKQVEGGASNSPLDRDSPRCENEMLNDQTRQGRESDKVAAITGKEMVATNTSLSEDKPSESRSEGSNFESEDDDDDQGDGDYDVETFVDADTESEASDDVATDDGESGGEARGIGYHDDQYSHDEHRHGSLCQHSHDNQSDDESNDADNHKYLMAVEHPAEAIHACSNHNHELQIAAQRSIRLPDGSELFSVLLSVHFNDTLIDYSRRYASVSGITDSADSSTKAQIQDLERLLTLLRNELTDMTAGINPVEGAMSRHKRSTLLRYSVKLEFFVGQDPAANMPLLQFKNYDAGTILGEEAMELIKDMDEVVLDAIEYVNDAVVTKDIARYKLENCLCGDEEKEPKELENLTRATENLKGNTDEQSSEARAQDKDDYLDSEYGNPLFSVSLNIHFNNRTVHHSRIFVSAQTEDQNNIGGLCDLDFKHLLRLIETPCRDLLNRPELSKENDLTVEEHQKLAKFIVQIGFSTGASQEVVKQYIIYEPPSFKDETPQAITATLENCILDAVEMIDDIVTERAKACKQPGYDPCSLIPDLEVRRSMEKDERIAYQETALARLMHKVQEAHAQLRKYEGAGSGGKESCGGCSVEGCGAADAQAHGPVPSSALDRP